VSSVGGEVLVGAGSIRVSRSPKCILCGSPGEVLYEGLRDTLYGVPGEWSLRRCSNRGCLLVWLDPAPVEEDIGAVYATYFTHQGRDGRAGLPKRVFRQIRASYLRSKLGYVNAIGGGRWRWLAPIANLHPGSGEVFAASAMFLDAPAANASLLDVGAGSGDFMSRMEELGWKVSGVEPDPVAAQRGRARGLQLHHGDLDSAGFADETFDAITMAHVIEHVHDPVRLLARCRRLLKPGGRVVILTPNIASWGHRHFGRDWLSLDSPRHLHLFNPRNMRDLLGHADLAPLRIATLAINASAVWPTSAAIRRARASAGERLPSVRLKATPGGLMRQLAERVRLSVDPSAGEDLLAIATRAN
jgi:2-polyprenyl-3-methyl-5-hydroxy-6-metoxy-1,4-benzoquinol methylase